MKRCAFTEQAEADLTAIALYIADDNPTRALSFVAELRERCAEIAGHPDAFRLREEYGRGIRVAVYRRYLIFFSATADAVLIEHIRHGARDLEGFRL